MKNFFLALIILSILPSSIARSDNEAPKLVFVVVAGALAYGSYQSYKAWSQNRSLAPASDSESSVDKILEDDDKAPEKDSDGKDEDKPEEKDEKESSEYNDAAIYEAIKNSNLRLIEKQDQYKNLPLTKEPEQLAPKTNANILGQQNTPKLSADPVIKKASFMEKWINYSADYKELHNENLDIFQG